MDVPPLSSIAAEPVGEEYSEVEPASSSSTAPAVQKRPAATMKRPAKARKVAQSAAPVIEAEAAEDQL
eukprot:2789733-Alexandrium_andersonii.AAC.1